MRVILLDGHADLERREVTRHGQTVRLTEIEASLLGALATRPNVAVTRGTLLEEVWGYHPGSSTRTVDTAVRRLRAKVEPEPGRPQIVLTAHGVGYRYQPPEVVERPAPEPPMAIAPRARIPVDATSFLGREGESRQLERFLDDARGAVIHGPGGVGKSRLARQAAHTWSRRTGGQAWWIPCTELTDATSLVTRIAHGMQLRLPAAGSRLDALGERLGRMGPTLVLLDGADRLDEATLARLEGWVGGDSELRLLLTRRRRLGAVLPTLRLQPLPSEHARELFVDRARTRVSGFDPDPDSLARVMRSLGGLPLAIQLAASRVRILDLATLAERLDAGLHALRDRSDPGEHGAMQRVLQRSWDFLDEDQRAILSECSVFRGPFSLQLAREVSSRPEPDLVLESLVDDGLMECVRGEHGVQFELLDCVRVFASEKGEAGGATERLAAALARRATQALDPIFGPTTASGCSWLRQHALNMEVALLAAPDRDRPALLIARAWAASEVGDADTAMALWTELDSPLGRYHLATDSRRDVEDRQALLRGLRARGTDPRLAAAALLELGRVISHAQGDEACIDIVEQALSEFTEQRDTTGMACSTARLSDAAAGTGDLRTAVLWRRKVLELVEDTDLLVGHRLRLVPYPLPPHEAPTLREYLQTAELARAAGDRLLLSHALQMASHRALEDGRVDPALRAAREAVETVRGVQSPTARAGVYGNAGIAFRELARFEEAHDCFRALEVELGDNPLPAYRLAVAMNQAWCFVDQGRLDAARARMADLPQAGPFDRARVELIRATIDALAGTPRPEVWRRARERFVEAEAPTHQARAATLLATLDPEDADDLLHEAIELCSTHGDVSILRAAEWLGVRRGHPVRSTREPGSAEPSEYLSFVRLIQRLWGLSHPVT